MSVEGFSIGGIGEYVVLMIEIKKYFYLSRLSRWHLKI